MARARNIKPGFFRDEHIVELPFEARLLFIGLWTLADREGRLKDRPVQIKIDIFPCDNVNVDKLLNQLKDKGFIIRYQVDGERYIQVVNFVKHQNPHIKEQASEIPAPDMHGASTVQTPDEQDACTADSLSLDSPLLIPDSPIPQPDPDGSESVPKKLTQKRKDELFALFWQAYPNKKSKGQAEKAWNKMPLTEILFTLIMSKLTEARSSPDWTKDNGQYIPHPATWLNAKGWEDEYQNAEIEQVPQPWHGLKTWADRKGVVVGGS